LIVLILTVAVFSSIPLLMVSYVVSVETIRKAGGYWLAMVLVAGGIGAYQGQKLEQNQIQKAVTASIAGIVVAVLVGIFSLYLVVPIIGE